MAIKAYLQTSSPVTANLDRNINIKSSDWEGVTNKPFDTVDEDTLSTEDGVLKFKTGSYNQLTNHPSIEDVTLKGNKTFAELGMEECSILDIEKMFL